ncbi:acyltransferase [Vibrio cholerae]|uniref:acyltransferase n=1 Tax=Vibrio cholerae TaxID=666 RepID=UPI001965424B|nr:acyltransferase [Vibrio cholerae]
MEKKLKSLIKAMIDFIAFPYALFFIFLYKMGFNYKTCGTMISKVSGLYGISIRKIFYKKTLKYCGDNLRVFYGAYICYPSVTIGNNCTIEEYSIVSNCSIGNDVIIAANVSIMSGAHHHDVDDVNRTFIESTNPKLGHVTIGDNIWIGTHSVVMNDISSNSVVAAGAVVTKSFKEEYVVLGGVPAKIIKRRGI